MRVLIVDEGKHESSGALEALVRRLAHTQNFECESDRVQNKTIHAFHGKGGGFFKRTIRWLIEAKKRRFDAIVLLIDEDGHPERIEQIDRAQSYAIMTLPRAFGVAVRAFDAWMLADETALSSVLSITVQRLPEPETIRDPKQRCAELLECSSVATSLSAMYLAVAEVAELETIKERCPRGFHPFAERVSVL